MGFPNLQKGLPDRNEAYAYRLIGHRSISKTISPVTEQVTMRRMVFHFLLVFFLAEIFCYAHAQTEKHSLFRDTLDNAFDVSRFLIEVKGFVAIPFILTEPALGNFGGGLGLVFLTKRQPLVDTIRGKIKITPLPPDITGGGGFYSANNSWGMIGFRSGMWAKPRIRYRIIGGYVNLNLSLYRTLDTGEDHEFRFNFKTIPISGYMMKQFRGTTWSAGLQYLFLQTQFAMQSGEVPEFAPDGDIKKTVSLPAAVVEFDSRDNIFTPNKGIRFHLSYGVSDDAAGSDYNYQLLDVYAYGYHPFAKNLIGGLRYDMQQSFDSPPFYLLPYLNLRGVPTARYQGNIAAVFESEVRWDFVRRWSVVGFLGSGKATDKWSAFGGADWVVSGGGGFRYLIARQFRLRMGMDLARGPEQWAYYIVFGSAWLR
jgi:hypothetical protein